LSWPGAVAGFCLSLLSAASPAGAAEVGRTPLLSLGAGYFDSTANQPRNRAVDLRVEYRFAGWDLSAGHEIITFRPWVGVEATTDGMIYGLGGFAIDLAYGPVHLVPSFGAGLHHDGSGKHLGSPVEFRSSIELGWAFDDGSRIGLGYGHISNAGLTRLNPGVEIVSLYYHLPM